MALDKYIQGEEFCIFPSQVFALNDQQQVSVAARGAKAFPSITTEPAVSFSCANDDVGHLWGDFS